jgi:hypothetical protein
MLKPLPDGRLAAIRAASVTPCGSTLGEEGGHRENVERLQRVLAEAVPGVRALV